MAFKNPGCDSRTPALGESSAARFLRDSCRGVNLMTVQSKSIPQHYRQFHGDAGAFAQPATDAALSAQQSRPLADAFQAKMVLGNGLRIKANSPITNLDSDVIAMLHETDLHLLALAVLAGICQSLLGNPVDAVLQGRVQSVKIDFAVVLDLRPYCHGFPHGQGGRRPPAMPDSSRIGGRTPAIRRRAS